MLFFFFKESSNLKIHTTIVDSGEWNLFGGYQIVNNIKILTTWDRL